MTEASSADHAYDSLDAAHLAPILMSIRNDVKRIADEVCGEVPFPWQVGVTEALARIERTQSAHTATMARIEAAVTAAPVKPSLGGHFEGFENERTEPMPDVITLPEAKDNQRWKVRILPRKADGHINAALTGVEWVSTDPATVGTVPGTQPFDFEDVRLNEDGTEAWREVVTCPGFFRCKLTTPLASGSGVNVTVSAPGYASAVFENLTYSQGVPMSLNAGFGEIESDDTDDPNW